MKGRFSTVDIAAIVKEWKRFVGMRVVNVYDIDNKTYLIRLNRPEEKAVLLLESGIRLHSTDFDWPKNPAPSGFSMKLRKHLKNRRLEGVHQLGMDRIVDLQFGSDEAAYHVILELYDRGNIVLTDFEFTILNILRPRTDQSQDVRLVVHETYPRNVKQHVKPEIERIREILNGGKNGDPLKKLLLPHLDYGPAILEHCLLSGGFSENVRLGNSFNIDQDMDKLMNCLEEGEKLLVQIFTQPTKGYITQRKDKRPNPKDGESEELLTYEEFHPYLYHQLEKKEIAEHPTFDKACDEFFSKVESQRLDMKALQQERTALKKLEHVKKDNEKRIQGLQQEQETDAMKGQLIELNLQLVDQAILIVRNAIANQIDWSEIWNLIKEAQMSHDPVAMAIKGIKLDTNHITMALADPYLNSEDSDEDGKPTKPTKVDIDLSLSAYANSRKYFEKKKTAKKKEQKTLDASSKAFKSAEKKALKALKEVATAVSINKTRKTYWFEKFLWFISSESFLVIGGRDSQQNELIVKRYFRPGDLYVHADLHGASSVIIKNHTSSPVPPKTLNEAGTMAICNSAAWDAKVITSAWYVYHEQVSKTAPSGEYLTTGSFMIRGKKNYLPPSYLIYGFTLLFKLEEGSVDRHRGERKVKTLDDEDEAASVIESEATDVDPSDAVDDDDEDDDEDESNSEEDVSVKQEEEEEEEEEEDNQRREVTAKEEEAEVKPQLSSDDIEEKPEESSFPDTSISLQHVKGEKFELQRGISMTSALSSVSDLSEQQDDTVIFLGDDKPIVLGEKKPATGKQKLSAKQRRDLKKGKKDQTAETTVDTNDQSQIPSSQSEKQKEAQQQQPLKRGQKAKLRKIKEKYGDQDEEERQLRMGILQSDGPKKEPKRKGKKAKELQQRTQQQAKRTSSGKPQSKPVVPDILDLESLGLKDTDDQVICGQIDSERVNMKTEDLSDEEKDDDGTQTGGDVQLMESLTGLPVPEDEILYAVPMCAPYNCLTNYKYKVKILPGNTKRGKATKTALNMFVTDKTASSREKDLIKILKDVDISRNLPGKVKLQAPNITKKKK